MNMNKTRPYWVFLALSVVTCSVMATERTWMYMHTVVKDAQDEKVAELSRIGSINVSPIQERILIKIGDQLLVARFTSGDPSPMNASYQLVSTGEILSITDPNETAVTVSVGNQSFSFTESDSEASIRSQAATLLATCSSTFQSTLNAFTTLGLNTYKPLYPRAMALKDLFFPTASAAASRNGKDEGRTTIKNFNPNTTPPSTFDSAFGNAYYE